MALPILGAVGAGLGGLLSGIFGGKQAGNTAQNYYANSGTYNTDSLNKGIGDALAGTPTTAGATQSVQSSPIYGQLFGNGGLMNQTGSQISDLMKNGFSLNNDDKTAYGQAAGDIARQFGHSEQGLAQALANRGLSSSGVAGQAFSNSFGNKQEQLAGLQTQIANNRMQMNLQRLGQMQNFMSQLGNQAQGAVGQAFNQQYEGNQQKYNMNKGLLDSIQNQANEQISQQNQGAHNSTMGNAMSGLMGGLGTANSMLGKGGMFGQGGAFGPGMSGK